jgi:hypothetical protein
VKVFAPLLAVALVGLLLLGGGGEPFVREAIRWTARSSLVFLCVALAGDGGRTLSPAIRAELLRCLAVSHGVHAVFVVTLGWLTAGRNLLERSSPIVVLGATLAYVFILLGALRPSSRATSAGLVWIWAVFMVSYGTRALREPLPWSLAIALLVLAMALRVSNAWRFGLREPEPGMPATSA